jgi:hypothetical protein
LFNCALFFDSPNYCIVKSPSRPLLGASENSSVEGLQLACHSCWNEFQPNAEMMRYCSN